MLFYIISDIHLELRKGKEFTLPPIKADMLILAGDISSYSSLDLLDNFLKSVRLSFRHIIYIAGNHEFYNCEYDRKSAVEKLREISGKNDVIFLNRESVVIEGIRFIGATLWSLVESLSIGLINDFSHSHRNQLEYVENFFEDFTYLRNQLDTSYKSGEKVVVITHHLPTKRLIHPRFNGSPMNSAFATNILDDINTRAVKFWLCGHTHEFSEIKLDKTFFICNPVGYLNEKRETKLSEKIYEI